MLHVNCWRLIHYTPLGASVQKYIFFESWGSLLSKNKYFYGVMPSDFLVHCWKPCAFVCCAKSTLLALRGSMPNLRYRPRRLNEPLLFILPCLQMINPKRCVKSSFSQPSVQPWEYYPSDPLTTYWDLAPKSSSQGSGTLMTMLCTRRNCAKWST